MANEVTTQILENGESRLVMKFTSFSDGTAESVVKVDATDPVLGVSFQGQIFPPGRNLVVTGIEFDVMDMRLRVQWEGNTDTDMVILDGCGRARYRDVRAGFGGLTCAGVAGASGSIIFTTDGALADSSYSVVLHMLKGVPQGAGSGGILELEDGGGFFLLEDGGGYIILEG